MYLGRFSVGDYLPLAIPSRTPNGVVSTLDAAPVCTVYENTTSKATVALHSNPTDRNSFVRHYIIPAALGDTTIQKYSILYGWVIGGDQYYASDNFEVVPTSTDYGSVIGLFGVTRTGGQWVLTQVDERGLYLGFNPSGN